MDCRTSYNLKPYERTRTAEDSASFKVSLCHPIMIIARRCILVKWLTPRSGLGGKYHTLDDCSERWSWDVLLGKALHQV
jgi:hypothetical protein